MKSESAKAWDFITKNRLAALATISEYANSPQVSFVYYVIDETFSLYIATTKDSRKIANITHNSHVALAISQETNPVTLQLEGVAKFVEDPVKNQLLIEQYLHLLDSGASSTTWPPLLKLPSKDGFVFIKVEITWFKFSDFTGTNSSIIEGTAKDWL